MSVRFLSILLLVFIGHTGRALAWCGGTEQDDWREFASLYSAGPPLSPQRPIVYILGAPWCPICAQAFRSLQSGNQYKFDVRFIPTQGASETHSKQIVDLVVDGSTAALVRTYVQRSFGEVVISKQQREFIEDVQDATDSALRDRYGKNVRVWGSPIGFLFTKDNVVRVSAGLPIFPLYDKEVSAKPIQAPQPNTRRFIKSGIPEGVAVSGNPFAKQDNVKLRILPDDSALSAVCVARGNGFLNSTTDPPHLINIDNQAWLAFKMWSIDKPGRPPKKLRAYGRADQFGGWQAK